MKGFWIFDFAIGLFGARYRRATRNLKIKNPKSKI